MKCIMTITADPKGDSHMTPAGRMWAFPWPPGIVHRVEVPTPAQASAPYVDAYKRVMTGQPMVYGNQPWSDLP